MYKNIDAGGDSSHNYYQTSDGIQKPTRPLLKLRWGGVYENQFGDYHNHSELALSWERIQLVLSLRPTTPVFWLRGGARDTNRNVQLL